MKVVGGGAVAAHDADYPSRWIPASASASQGEGRKDGLGHSSGGAEAAIRGGGGLKQQISSTAAEMKLVDFLVVEKRPALPV